jgi:hypothetical protein
MSKTKVTSWPRDPLDNTKCYRAKRHGLIYELTPAKKQPGYWHARVKERKQGV